MLLPPLFFIILGMTLTAVPCFAEVKAPAPVNAPSGPAKSAVPAPTPVTPANESPAAPAAQPQPATAARPAPWTPVVPPPKITIRQEPNEAAAVLEIDGQAKLRVHSNNVHQPQWEFLNSEHNLYLGERAGERAGADAKYNVFVGSFAGILNVQGKGNTFLGVRAGSYCRASQNTCLGAMCGTKLGLGEDNAFVGYAAGAHVSSGARNTLLGSHAAGAMGAGSDNIVIGFQAGSGLRDGTKNLFAGSGAGYRNQSGTGNVFLGYQAGFEERGDNRLYIENSRASRPLIYGEFDARRVGINAAVGIGTQRPLSQLHVVQGNQAADDGLRLETLGLPGSWRMFLDSQAGRLLHFSPATAATEKNKPVAAAQTSEGRIASLADARHQKQVDSLTGVTEKLARLVPQQFRNSWQKETELRHFGFTAQDVQAIFPELVVHEQRTDTFLIDYAGLSVVAVRAVQEQQEQLRRQQERITRLEQQSVELLGRVTKLEAAPRK